MSVVLCTLVLNEMEWLPKLYEQHKDWSGMLKWVFVESADGIYASTNPDMVNNHGLSVDGTTEFLENLTKNDDRITHVKHGLSRSSDPAQGKCAARQRYLDEANKVYPNVLVVVDGDEFYPKLSQLAVEPYMNAHGRFTAMVMKHRDIWRPPSITDKPLFELEVTGGFWDIPYCRLWRWAPRLRYASNHNTPETPGGVGLDRRMKRLDQDPQSADFVHMAFASSLKCRVAKHKYYVARGEGKTDRRQWYVDSRAAFETWEPGVVLPSRAKVIPYTGHIPEAFQ